MLKVRCTCTDHGSNQSILESK